ncbi:MULTISPECIES: hypothetical protein [Actinomadura]|uniref:Uncharacterized protein n=1 Tax=Actinomadura yumaensis TaxID=111807 RepID=A0ABW2CG61_9ACTN|nr:hypothetical protein [Actinomadura sp. J1-007]
MTPDALERDHTLLTAAARYDDLRTRESLTETPLARTEALELVALGELIARKAGHGRQPAVRSARRSGASWSQIGAALGTSKQAAWETHNRWLEDHASAGLTTDGAPRTDALAGDITE